MWRIQLLGGLTAKSQNRTITRFRTQKAAELFAYLAYYSGKDSPAHSRETLIGMLWPDTEPTTARHYLSVELTSLRHILEPPVIPPGTVLVTDRYSIRLHSATVSSDVALFEEAVRKSVQPHLTEEKQISFLLEAAELYQGPLLPGLYTEWIGSEATRLNSLLMQVASQAVPLLLQRDAPEQALAVAQRAVTVDTLSEVATQDVMRVLMALGQPSQAFRQYRELERRLQQELQEKPSLAMQAWAAQLRHDEKEKKQEGVPPETPRSEVVSKPFFTPTSPFPSGTVTFLLTDLEGSTALWERGSETFREAQEMHHAVLRQAFARHGGQAVKQSDDGFLAVFARAGDALACALSVQRALAEQTWPQSMEPLGVRIALHTSSVEANEGNFHDLSQHRVSRILFAAHGRQSLCSETTAALLWEEKPPDVELIDLGRYRLRGIERAVRLFQVAYPGMTPRQFPRPHAEPETALMLLPRLTRFFGREAEISRLEAMLSGSGACLVTITGPGGIGKTRLALEATAHLIETPAINEGQTFPFRRACFVPLADVKEAERIPNAILRALGVQPEPDRDMLEQVLKAISEEPGLLLILDNFEQLVEKGTLLVRDLMLRASKAKFLVTSRQSLHIEGEQEFHLAPLPLTGGAKTPRAVLESVSAVMFVDRAQAVRPDFQVTDHNAEAIGTLCDRLEGIPLAIELAAARTQILSPAHILEQVQAARLDFLATRRRDAASRQRTLRATLDWSYQLLTEPAQAFLAQLSAFQGGWTLEAAQAVCECSEAETLELLTLLRDNSLIGVTDTCESLRFTLLETVREYAREHLDRSEKQAHVWRRHHDYFLALAEEASQEKDAEKTAWYDRLEADNDNLRAALERYQQNADETGLRLAVSLFSFWEWRGYWREGVQYLTRLLVQEGRQNPLSLQASALFAAGILLNKLNDFPAARQFLEEGLAIQHQLGEKQNIADSLRCLGNVTSALNDVRAAHSYFEQAVNLYREIGEQRGEAMNLSTLGLLAWDEGNYTMAQSFFEQSLALARRLGSREGETANLTNMGGLAQAQGNFPTARSYFEQALAINRELDHRGGIVNDLCNLGETLRLQGDLAAARVHFEQALALNKDLGNRLQEAEALLGLGRIAQSESHYKQARSLIRQSLHLSHQIHCLKELAAPLEALAALLAFQKERERAVYIYGATHALRERLPMARAPIYGEAYQAQIEALHRALGEKVFSKAWEAGTVMSLEQALEYALQEEEPAKGK